MPAEMPVAVVVQRMVTSEKSGVMFTVDPATRDPTRVVIEAAWGLGEVGGAAGRSRRTTTSLDKQLAGRWSSADRREGVPPRMAMPTGGDAFAST